MSEPIFSIQSVSVKESIFQLETTWPAGAKLEEHLIMFNIAIDSQEIKTNEHEVNLKVSVNTKHQDKMLSKCQVVVLGNFSIQNIDEKQMPLLLNIQCPLMLYPYVQERVANAYLHSTLPIVTLPLINFELLYKNKLKSVLEVA